MRLSAPLYRLKREAKVLSRTQNVPLHVALDAIASREGMGRWSLLSAKHKAQGPAVRLLGQLVPGDLLLLAARPGQGKTALALELALHAMRQNRHAAFFTLEYTAAETLQLFRDLGEVGDKFTNQFQFDNSEDICADYIIAQLADAAPETLVVIDYLQQLDLKRAHAPLEQQIRQLKKMARQRGLMFVFISQVARDFELKADTLPGLADVRLPNPLDLTLFNKACFLGEGDMELSPGT